MNIFKFCEQFNISLAKARKMDKAGVLRLDENTPPEIDAIRHNLSRGQRLTAAQLVYMIESKDALSNLGRFAPRVVQQIDDLRDNAGRIDPAPTMVSAYISDAAKGDAEAVGVLVDWIKEILPGWPVNHSYIAIRLLMGLAPNIREFDIPRVPRALYHCRQHVDFTGWWHLGKAGTRAMTIYRRPKENVLDL